MATYEILVDDTGERFHCAASENLLKAMERLNRKGIPVGCRGGGCGVCKIRIHHGQYSALKMSREHVSLEEAASGIALACRVMPNSDLTVHVLGGMRKGLLAQFARAAPPN